MYRCAAAMLFKELSSPAVASLPASLLGKMAGETPPAGQPQE
jgi:hypothetical protein